jgi:hypothetical protein
LEIIDNLIDSLQYLGVEVINHEQLKNNHLIITDVMLLDYFDDKKKLSISFDVSVKPEMAAGFTLFLKENVENINDIYVMESYHFDNEGNVISGDEAYKLFNIEKEKVIFNSFVKDRMQKEVLIHTKPFNC